MREISPTPEKALEIYKSMLTIRMFEIEISRRWPEQEMRSPPHLYMGQEATASGICAALEPKDKVIGYYRGHGYYLAKGGDPNKMMAEMYCKSTGSNKGKAGSMLLSAPEVGYMGSSAIVGGGIPIATGVAFANKFLDTGRVTVCFLGDAATEEGVFPESLNYAALAKLPIVYVCENNYYAVTTHISLRRADPDGITKVAKAYGVPAERIDGYNPIEVYSAAKSSIDAARSGQGPYLLEAMTYRWKEHVGEKYDDFSGQRTKEELADWMIKDPITLLAKILLQQKIANKASLISIVNDVEKTVQNAFEFGKESPLPSKDDLLKNV